MALKHAGITLLHVLTAEMQVLPVDIKKWIRRSFISELDSFMNNYPIMEIQHDQLISSTFYLDLTSSCWYHEV